MNSTMETIYRKIELEGVWLVDPKQTTREQQDAILALRKAGKIEQAAYGGLKVKRDWRVPVASVQPTPERAVVALLVAAGITPVGEILPCKSAWAWSPNCYAFVMPRGVVLGAAKEAFKRVVVNDRLVVVELKG